MPILRRLPFLWLLLSLLLTVPAVADPVPADAALVAPQAAKARQIETLLDQYHAIGRFNGAALVAEGGKVIFKGGFGEANMEWHIPNAPDTRFRIGSVTKQFTAALVLQLVEEGKIDLQKHVTDYLSDYPPAQGAAVTIHQLLTHTSGIPSYTGLPTMKEFERDPYDPEAFLAVFSGLDLEFTPGSEWRYSNSGYYLLGVIVSKVAGKPYSQVLHERILDPLGLTDTGYDLYGQIIERRASGYVKVGGGYEHAAYLDSSIPFAAGMMYSTVEDLFKWDQLLYDNGPFAHPETKQLMFTPHAAIPAEGSSGGGDASYGYGWVLREQAVGERKVKVIEHGGGIYGFTTAFWRMPEERNTVIVMDNATDKVGGDIADGLVNILYGLPVPAPKPPISDVLRDLIDEGGSGGRGVEDAVARYRELKAADPDAYDFGESELNDLGYESLRRGDTATAIALFKLNVEAYPDSANVYDSLGEGYLAAGEKEQAIASYRKALELDPESVSAQAALRRLEMPESTGELSEQELESYVGGYRLAPTFILTITREGSRLFAQATGQPRFEIFPAEKDEFVWKVVDARVTFHRDEAGAVESLTLHQNGLDVPGPKIR